MKTEDFETGDWETGRRDPERVTLTVQSETGLLMAATFDGVMTTSLAMDDERLAMLNRALGLAGAWVDYAGGAS